MYNLFFIYVFIVIFLAYLNYNKSNKLKNSTEFKQIIESISLFLQEIEEAKKQYFTNSSKTKLITYYEDTYTLINKPPYNKIKNEHVEKFNKIYSNMESLAVEWNKEYIDKELIDNKELFDDIDGKSLDEQQRRAIVIDEDNNLVLAGAGSGKTLTISGKVKYLVNVKNIAPDEILLISFTKKAADEMNERISQRLGLKVESKTFHKLGLDIIKKKRGQRPDISENLDKAIDNYFKNTIYYDLDNLKNLITFFGCYINIPKDMESFENLGEYYKYCKSANFTTLKGKYEVEGRNKLQEQELKVEKKTIKGEQVKSIEEVIIANYLYLNGIDYIYEYKYPYDSGDKYRKTYRPDFYLPDYDIYIEHFGVNRNYKAPWLSKVEEQKYIEDMKWKRDFHKMNSTTLVETYSYYNKDGILLSRLEKKLSNIGVRFKTIDYKEIYSTIFDNKEDRYFKELRKLISTFIGLFKSSGYVLYDFNALSNDAMKINNEFLKERSLVFLDIVKPIYIEYQNSLAKNEEIDFNDMINESTDIVKSGCINYNYKYIIIDEYQDISKSRFNLIKEIKEQTNSKLMCVGDDWQSIYRFTGSDINLFTNFEKHVGHYELLKIEKTYRNSQELIDIVGKFVMKNKNQLRKDLKSEKRASNPIRVISYIDDIYIALENSIDEIVYNFGSYSEITILGRNNLDVEILSKDKSDGRYEIIRKKEEVLIKYNKNTNLKIKYLTVHKSKGLEADNVIIINLENKTTGFPNQMVDDPVLDLVLIKSDGFDYAEERRLFYVALTRTKNISYLIVPDGKSSTFCDELVKDFNIKPDTSAKGKIKESPKCPKCLDGNLIKRKSSRYNTNFISCTNYPMCDFTNNTTDILDNEIICKSCGGYMVKRIRRNEPFLGCTNYPHCRNTEEYIKPNESEYEENKPLDDKVKTKHYEGILEKEEREACYSDGNEYIETELEAIISDLKKEEYIVKNHNDEIVEEKIYAPNKGSVRTKELYIKYRGEENYKFYKTYRENSILKIGSIFKDGDKDFIITDIYVDSIFIQSKEDVDTSKMKPKSSDRDKWNSLYTTNICNENNRECSILALKEELINQQNNKCGLNKKLWIQGFIKYMEGSKLYPTFTIQELNKIIYYNKLMRDEWFIKDVPAIKQNDFNNYKKELVQLDKQIKVN